MDKLKKDFASKLLNVKAIKLQPNDPFTWASGWKSPFYCDNRKTLSFPELRNYVKLELVHTILEQFPEADAVAGVATGAIAQGALVADELNLPFVYVRSKPKDHGMQNLIEGELKSDAKVVVVEDLISTGGSSLKAVEALRKNGNEVIGMVASYTGAQTKKRARLQPERGHSARTARSHKDSHTQQARQKKDFRRKPDTQEPMGTQHQCAGCLCPVARLRTRRKQGRKPRTQTSAHRRRRVHNRSHHHFMLPGTHEGNRLDEVQHPHLRIRQRTISSKNK